MPIWMDGCQIHKEGIEYSKLDLWLLAELHALIRDVTNALENYDVLVQHDQLKNLLIICQTGILRRSRRRFWKSESDDDKYAAYATLYEALVTVSKLLAPTMPFIAEEIYSNLVMKLDTHAPKSIHIADWPSIDQRFIDPN